MRKRATRFATAGLAAALMISALSTLTPAAADDVLSGVVSSDAEGRMEGVVVIAQREGSPVLTAVVSDKDGRYRFPRTHLQQGQHTIMIRAAGYMLPSGASVQIDAGRTAELDLRLRQATIDELAHHLTNTDWWNSMPGTDAEKDLLVRKMGNCGSCHDLERVARSRYSADQFLPVMQRMAIYAGDNSSGCGTGSALHCDVKTPGRVQIGSRPPSLERMTYGGADARTAARILASMNLSGGKSTWDYKLKAMSRPKGRATRVIVTVFPIPRQPSVVHDLAVDSNGQVWYGDSGWGYLGKLDPKTGAFSEYEAPNLWEEPAPGLKKIVGVQDLELDADGNVWITAIGGHGMAYFDPRTQKWVRFDVPAPTWAFLPTFLKTTPTVWTTGRVKQEGGAGPLTAYRLNYKSGQVDAAFPVLADAAGKDVVRPVEAFGAKMSMPPFCYQLGQDLQGNFLCNDFYGSSIIALDARTGARKVYATPTPDAAPRRGRLDPQGRFWFGEFWADKIGMLDFKSEKIREFAFSTKYASGYAAAGNANGEGWGTSHGSDRILRVNAATGESVEYLMPVYTDARKIVFDPSTPKTTVWLPNKNLAQLIRIEPQD